MWKKTSAALVLILFVLSVFPPSASAETWGEYEYSVHGAEATITNYTGSGPELIIPGEIGGYTVTAIGENAFSGNAGLKSVSLPESIRVIRHNAFSSCPNLAKAVLEKGIESIGEGAFTGCPGLTIYGYKGTAAEVCAKKNNLPFVPLDVYTVKFDSRGGSTVKSVGVQHGNTLKAPAAPTRTGYTFGGWYRESSLKTAWNFDSDKVTGPVTLYAKWKYGEPGASYKASAAAGTVYSGKSVKFTLTTPRNIYKIKIYIDGKYYKSTKTAKLSGASRLWTYSVVLKNVGKRKIQFKAYNKRGSFIKKFPASPVVVTVKHALPDTKPAVVLDSDRAALIAKPPVYSGVKQKSHGFYIGTSEDNMTTKISSNSLVRGFANRLVTGLSPETGYYFCAYTLTSAGEIKGPVLSFVTPPKREWKASDVIFKNTADRYNLLFGRAGKFYTRSSPPFGYANSSEASKHIVKVTVPVWKLSGGIKTQSTRTLYVHYKLAENIKEIFNEIYALDIKFPIAQMYCYQYRRVSGDGLPYTTILSHHSFGAAIDINWTVNDLYIGKDKRNTKSPYYIPKSVIDIFEKYGWAWGGKFKECKDTMHFQYLGLDLIRK